MSAISVSSLGYIELGVKDIAAWREYAGSVLGLKVTESEDGLMLQMDDKTWRIQLVQSEDDDILCAGFEVADEKMLGKICDRLSANGFEVCVADAIEKEARGVEHLFKCCDPDGLRIELFVGSRLAETAFVSPANVSDFVTDDKGLGHIVLFVSDQERADLFYQTGLGFLLSDHITMGPEGHQLKVTFLHCNSRHHTLAFAPVALPKKLNHIMLEVASLDDVGLGFDRAKHNQVPISSSLGCHTNDKMVSFYMKTPSGFDIEYGCGGIEIDDETWQTTTYDSPSIWGHKDNLN